MTGCECDPLAPAPPVVSNPPGQPALRWQVAPHGSSVARMRAVLAEDSQSTIQAMARHGTDEPAVALLDAWAVVADIVSFYTERIAEEGFLRTATELRSVRELARTLGYELRPGVAASAELAFTVEDAPGGPVEVLVSAGTPVQTIPAQGQLPQTFETSKDLLARPAWNAIPGAVAKQQEFDFGGTEIWLRGTGLGVREGDPLVIVGQERLRYGQAAEADRDSSDADRWDFRIVDAVTENPDGLAGWTKLQVHSALNSQTSTGPVSGEEGVAVFTFAERANVFGWNAPNPALLKKSDGTAVDGAQGSQWNDFNVGTGPDDDIVELDGDHPRVHASVGKGVEDYSWIVLDAPSASGSDAPSASERKGPELCRIVQVTPSGVSQFALSGRTTNVKVDIKNILSTFDPRSTLVHCQSRALPSSEAPRIDSVRDAVLDLVATDPLLPSGRRVLVTGYRPGAARTGSGPGMAAALPPLLCEQATVLDCTEDQGGVTVTVTLDHALSIEIDPQTLRVLANIIEATHGETVQQVLGSGDGRVPFAQFQPSRPPLTYVGADNPSGVRSTMELRVDGVAWTEVASLDTAAGHDRVFTVRRDEDGAVRLVIGDGMHGARASTGGENVTSTYRVGIGEPGAATAGQLSLLTRRPLGIRTVSNPGPAHDWAPPETLEDARRNAPLRIRTLDRAVSVADHEDFAAAFAGVGAARADEVWDGRAGIVVVSLLGTAGAPVSAGLITNLGSALAAARDPATPLRLLRGELLRFGISVDLQTDPAYQRPLVEQAVRDALAAHLAPAARAFVAPVTAARVLVLVRAVPGVLACTMPRLLLLPGLTPLKIVIKPPQPVEVLAALPARWEAGAIQPAQLLALAPEPEKVAIGVMTR